MDALTLPEHSLLRQDLSGSYDVTSAKTWFAPLLCRGYDQLLQYLHSTRTCYWAVIISINDFSSQVLWIALKDDRHIASMAKTKGSPNWEAYRPRPAFVNVSLIGRSTGAEPKIFLWNSLIKPPRVGDDFEGMVASVADPYPVGSGPFCQIWIRKCHHQIRIRIQLW